MQVAWPAVQSEPLSENERLLLAGASFHHLVHQHQLGLPAARLEAQLGDPQLTQWWESYLASPEWLPSSPGYVNRYAEIALSAPLGAHRLIAKYDLILETTAGGFIILDWKTSRQRPPRFNLEQRLQTRLYPYLLARAGAHLNQSQPVHPDSLEMVYWFAAFPHQPERFVYSARIFQEDEAYLTRLLTEIETLGPGEFPLTSDEKRCLYCVYRSLCGRGEQAGFLDELAVQPFQEDEVDLDFESAPEIEF
jgi:CRISPR/Cas system-associated exonuclease Cas4 (RecB family)